MNNFKCPPDSESGLELVLQGEYEIKDLNLGPNPIILDIGANCGAFSVWATERFPDSTIFAYEPLTQAYDFLLQNVGPNVFPRKCAISDFDGKARLWIGETNIGASSLRRDTGETGNRCGNVRVCHSAALPPADLLKIDTEGSELEILSHYSHLDSCKAVVLEWHSQADREKIRNLLASRRFNLVQDTELTWASGGRGIQKWVKAKIPHLYVGVVCAGTPRMETIQCLFALKESFRLLGWSLTLRFMPGTGTDRARNRCVADARSIPSITNFMFLDDDIVFEPQWVINMVQMPHDIVGAAYPRKQIEWDKVEEAVKKGVPASELSQHATSFIYNFVHDAAGGVNGMAGPLGERVEVEELGTGFLMMKMPVVEAMCQKLRHELAYVTDYEPFGEEHSMLFMCQRDPLCELAQAEKGLREVALKVTAPVKRDEFGKPIDYQPFGDLNQAAFRYARACADIEKSMGRYLTEDYAFCRLARMQGYQIYLYLDAAVKHIGAGVYEGQAKHLFKKAPMNISEIAPNLYQGACPYNLNEAKEAGFKAVVMMAGELLEVVKDVEGVDVLRCGLSDDLHNPVDPKVKNLVDLAGQWVADHVKEGNKVLVTCGQGLNRSGFCTASALHYLNETSGPDAIKIIQSQRNGALFNQRFCAAIREMYP